MTDATDTEKTTVDHFGVLVEYLSEYPADQREDLAELHGAPGAEPDDLARHWCQHPQDFVEVVVETLRTDTAKQAMRDVVFDHDLPIESDRFRASETTQLVEAGLLNRLVTSPFQDREIVFPGALAAILAGELQERRPSLAVLLGTESRERLNALAEEYELATTGSRVEVILRLMDLFAGADAVDAVVRRIADPDWLGPAMMALELGGTCYWREVFGYDFDDGSDEGSNVIPLMRQEERAEERRMADRLQSIGLLHRFQPPDTEYWMIAVPEELWRPVWSLGRGWLLDWTRHAYRGLRDRGAGGEPKREHATLQEIGKWVVCEAATGEMTLEGEALESGALERLRAAARQAELPVETKVDLLFELSILRRGLDGFVTLGAEYQKLLDMDAGAFVRNVLYEWCGGFVGTAFETRLPKAIGLDESWRQEALEILRARREFVPQWMQFEGVPQERTGAGCLREMEQNTPELVADEVGMTNGYVWSTKMLWLDLLSLLEGGRRYPLDGLVELAQMSASVCLFLRIGQLLEDARNYFYLPVQRASLLTEPFHTSEFERWLLDVFEGLLEPLGVASLDDSEEGVWLETEHLRVDSPPGWALEERERLLQQTLGREDLEFSEPHAPKPALEAVEEESDVACDLSERQEVSIARPIDEILGVAKGRPVEEFDGESVTFAPSEVVDD